jgi:RNase P subunit RPR2
MNSEELAKVRLTVQCACGFVELYDSTQTMLIESLEASVNYPGDEDEQAVVMFTCPQCKKSVRILP